MSEILSNLIKFNAIWFLSVIFISNQSNQIEFDFHTLKSLFQSHKMKIKTKILTTNDQKYQNIDKKLLIIPKFDKKWPKKPNFDKKWK